MEENKEKVQRPVEKFWNLVDSIDIESREDGRYTEDEIYTIGCAFVDLNNTEKREVGGWDKLLEILKPLDKNGEVMKKAETFRCWVKSRRYADNAVIHDVRLLSGKTVDDITFSEFEEKTEEIKRGLYKQQTKTRDVYNTYRRALREEARVDNFRDLLVESVANLKDLPEIVYERKEGEVLPCEAVMLLSDMHLGMTIDNFANKYNVEIARRRIHQYVHDTINVCKNNGVAKLNVVNLGDMIHGIIHVTGRLDSEQDVIEQISTAAEILAEALIELKAAAPIVVYRSVTDNHSRAMPLFSENVEKENFSRLIDIILKARLTGSGIVFAEDNLDYDISLIELMNGDTMICSHGHRDNINTIVQNYIGATKKYIEYVCVGHFHEAKMKSFQGAKVFINGCICGPDSYAQSKRLYGKAEQTLLLFDRSNVATYYINLDGIR